MRCADRQEVWSLMKPVIGSFFQLSRRVFRLAVWLLTILLLNTAAAQAHAALQASEPSDGAMLQAPPARLALTFSEPVTPLALHLAGPDGNVHKLDRFDIRNDRLEIEPPGELDRGTHVLSWRVVSADGHPV